jgi:thiol-disulfide isomerase/thioredoxin
MKLFSLLLIIFLVNISNHVFPQSSINPEVKILNVGDLSELINSEQEHPLLINVWATWCVPCREEFPDLVKISESYSNKVRVVGISVDDSEVLDSKVIPFLKNQKAKFENYLLKVTEPEDFINLLNKKWSGAIPATFIYKKNSEQNEMLIGKQSYELFEQAVKKVIN